MLLAWDYSDLKVNILILIFDDQIVDCILWPMMRIMGMKEWKDIVVDLVDEAPCVDALMDGWAHIYR